MPTVRGDSPIEEVSAPSKKTAKRHQPKKTIRNDEELTWMALSGAEIGITPNKPLLEYQAKYGVSFTLSHCWKELKYCENWKRVTGDDDEEDVQKVQRPMGTNIA
ncbi:hypothetical protein Tco_0268774 [Tanacetum coccineum]